MPERFFEKISRKMILGMEVLAHHPEELSLEIMEFKFLELSSRYEA